MIGPPLEESSSSSLSFPLLRRQISKESNESVNRTDDPIPSVCMVGTGEYTTGYVHGKASDSDKSAGVVALTMSDLRSRGLVNELSLCGVNGKKFPEIRQHLKKMITDVYSGLDLTMKSFPNDNEIDPEAYITAFDSLKAGDAVTIFTPDDTHFKIAKAAIERGLHVLVTKPAVMTLQEHFELHELSIKYNVLVCVEVHKRWDPIYADARDKIQGLGSFSYLYSYMSQPKHQLETFKAWLKPSSENGEKTKQRSDISYYLNSHHIDFHEWTVGNTSRPVKVTATASTGVAKGQYECDCEDTITLMVQWENLAEGGGLGTAVYTSSWVAPKSDVHSQQRFFYMGHKGEVNVDQAHRGYNMASDGLGFRSVNPLFMKYTPTDGKFSGQNGYGYRSFEHFVTAVASINRGEKAISDYDHSLASIATTYRTTAILEAGRRSLDEGRPITIVYEDPTDPCLPTNLQ